MKAEFAQVDLERCFVADTNARPGALGDLTQLTTSIKANGILVPLFVVERACKPGEAIGAPPAFEVVDGQRRLTAALAAGLTMGPAMVYDEMPDAAELGIALNVLREQLSEGQIAKAAGHVLHKLGFVAGDIRTLALAKKSSVKLLKNETIVAAAAACGVTPEVFVRYGALSTLEPEFFDRYAAGRIQINIMARIAEMSAEHREKLLKMPPAHFIGSTMIAEITGVRIEANQIQKEWALFGSTKDLDEVGNLFGEAYGLTPASAIVFMERQNAALDEIIKDLTGVGFTVTKGEANYTAKFQDRHIDLDRKNLKASISTIKGHDDKDVVINFHMRPSGRVEVTIRTKVKGKTATRGDGADEKLLSVSQYDEALSWLAQELLNAAHNEPTIILSWAAGMARLADMVPGVLDSPFVSTDPYKGFYAMRGQPEQLDISTLSPTDIFLATSRDRGTKAHLAFVAERLVRNMPLGIHHQRKLRASTTCLMAALGIDPRLHFHPSLEFVEAMSKAEIVGNLTRMKATGWLKTAPKSELAKALYKEIDGKMALFPDVAGWWSPNEWAYHPELFFTQTMDAAEKHGALTKAIEPEEGDDEGVDPAARPEVHAAHSGDTPDGTGSGVAGDFDRWED